MYLVSIDTIGGWRGVDRKVVHRVDAVDSSGEMIGNLHICTPDFQVTKKNSIQNPSGAFVLHSMVRVSPVWSSNDKVEYV